VRPPDPERTNWKPLEAGCVASFHPEQIEFAPKLATVPVFLTPNSQRILGNWQHFGYLVASFWVSSPCALDYFFSGVSWVRSKSAIRRRVLAPSTR
jgi:hypothetical protein